MKFRKKPVIVEAIQFDGSMDSINNICAWANCNEDDEPWVDYVTGDGVEVVDPLVHTLEGELNISVGDWIIKGVQEEFYPCKPDIFDATYEPVADSAEKDRKDA